jgi:hypothetical protein
MTFDSTTLAGFFNELETIQKEAAGGLWGGLGSAIGGAFTNAGKGFRALKAGVTGTGHAGQQLAGPQRWNAVKGGLKHIAPAAAVVGTGGLAAYGAGKAAFGN